MLASQEAWVGYLVEKGKSFFEFGDLIVCELVLHRVSKTRTPGECGRTLIVVIFSGKRGNEVYNVHKQQEKI